MLNRIIKTNNYNNDQLEISKIPNLERKLAYDLHPEWDQTKMFKCDSLMEYSKSKYVLLIPLEVREHKIVDKLIIPHFESEFVYTDLVFKIVVENPICKIKRIYLTANHDSDKTFVEVKDPPFVIDGCLILLSLQFDQIIINVEYANSSDLFESSICKITCGYVDNLKRYIFTHGNYITKLNNTWFNYNRGALVPSNYV